MASPQVLSNYYAQMAIYAKTHAENFKRIVQQQRTDELSIINETNSFCPLNGLSSRTATPKNIDKALEEGSEDPNILRTLMCLNNSLDTSNDNEIGKGFPVRKYFTNLKQIGSPSVEGYAATAQIRGGEERPYVIKSPQVPNPRTSENILHEYFVGAFGTNFLRGDIPNFSFVMGVFQCSPPYISDRKVLTYCQNDNSNNQVYNVLYENITDSMSLGDFIIKGCSYKDYLNVITQIVLALNLANKKIDYTHYDMHTENVLIKRLPHEIYIPYPEGYLKTKYLAIIIDLGRNHIKYQGVNYGFSLVNGGIFPDRSYYMYDIYKILGSSLSVAAFGNKNPNMFRGASDSSILSKGMMINAEVFTRGKELLRYFYPTIHKDYYADYLTFVSEYYFEFPYSQDYDLPVTDFLNRVVRRDELIEFISLNPPKDVDLIYGCSTKGVCLTLQRAIMKYSRPKIEISEDPYIFYQLYKQNPREFTYNSVKEQYPGYIRKLSYDAEKIITEYAQINKTQVIFPGSNLLTGNVDMLALQRYENYVNGIVKGFDIMTSLKEIRIILKTFENIFRKTPELLPKIEGLLRNVNYLNSALDGIKRDLAFLTGARMMVIRRINPRLEGVINKINSAVKAVAKISI
jgi:hypothetical protein